MFSVATVRDITERKRAEEALQQHTAQLEALREVGLELTAQLDLDTLLHSIVSRATELLGATTGGLYLHRRGRGLLELVASTGASPLPVGSILYQGEGLSGKVWETGEPLIVEDYQQWEGRGDIYEDYRSAPVVGVPIQWGDEFLGVLNIAAYSLRTFSPADVELLSLFATQAAIAIRNARLYEQTRQEIAERKRAEEALQWRNQELTLLNRAGRAFNSTLDLEQVLIQVLGTVRDLLEVLDSSIWLLDKETDELVCRYLSNSQSEGIRGWRLSLGQGIAGWTAKNGQSALVLDTREDPRHFEGVDQHIGREIRSLLAVPLWDQQAVFGVLEVVDTKPQRFAVADRQVIESLAATASIAIQNARLYAQTQQDAETKATLLREVNHRVGNNLAAIVGLLDLERKRAKVNSQAAYEAVMEDLVSRIQGLATAHHLLSAAEWSPLLLSELVKEVIDTGLQTLPLGEYVSVEVSSSPVRVTPRQANNLALVVNELTTNSAKHAWETRRARQIAVRIDGQDDTITLEFRDNGVGYPEEVLRLERHGVGWGLIQSLVGHSLQGEVALHNDGGAVTTLRFPAMGSGGSLTRRERKEGLN